MIPVLHLLASALVWLAIFLFAKLNWGITSNSALATTIVVAGIVVVFFGLNSLRLAFKSNIGVVAVVVLLSAISLFAMDYFIADFAIVSTGFGLALSFVIAVVLFGNVLALKAILGNRAQL
jgi:hypothetical protein